MKSKTILTLLMLCLCINIQAIDKVVTVKDAETNKPIGYVSALVTFSDSTTQSYMTDSIGSFTLVQKENLVRIDATAIGYKPISRAIASTEETNNIVLWLQPSSIQLNDVVVKGHAQLNKLTKDGISYNMKGDTRVKNENLLTALNKVPFVESSPDGTLKVRGTSNYLIYLNGRPYESAQRSIKTVLSSMMATEIDHVEVITNTSERYDVSPGVTILNICTKQKHVDGISVSSALGYTTQPTTNDGITLLIKKKNVDISVDYAYSLNGQRHQPYTIDYSLLNSVGEKSVDVHQESKGDGNWQSHTLRGMLEWRMDSVNTLYADINGNITPVNTTSNSKDYTAGVLSKEYSLRNKNTSGTIESNIIWRNYSRLSPDKMRFMLGYRYTYNPDRRHYYTTSYDAEQGESQTNQCTDGGMSEHTLTSAYLIKLTKNHNIRVKAKGILRLGRTNSTYNYADEENAIDRMRYNMGIYNVSANYQGYSGKFYWGGAIQLEQSHISMKLPMIPELNYKRDNTNILPDAYVYFLPSNSTQISLTYSESLTRPSVNMLNPFNGKLTDYFRNVGNPQLNPVTTHSIDLQLITSFTNGVFSVSTEYQHSNNPILPYNKTEGDIVTNTYENLGKTDDAVVSVYAQWNPCKWLSTSCSAEFGHRWLTASEMGLNQKEFHYSFAPHMDFYFPHNWNFSASYGMFKNLCDPWEKKTTLNQYSFSMAKSFLEGKLTVSIVANSPFEKYILSRTTTSMKDGSFMRQNNYITARSFGINIFYSFSKGKKVDIKRDRTLSNSDLQTGVQ